MEGGRGSNGEGEREFMYCIGFGTGGEGGKDGERKGEKGN